MTNKLHIFKRLNGIEKRLQKLEDKWLKYKTNDHPFSMLCSISWLGDENTTDASELLKRINEIYQFLGVTRDSVASKTFLKKKQTRKP